MARWKHISTSPALRSARLACAEHQLMRAWRLHENALHAEARGNLAQAAKHRHSAWSWLVSAERNLTTA